MSTIWKPCMAYIDTEYFNERSEERRQFFEELVTRGLPTTEFPPIVCALFQVADLERIRQLCQQLDESYWRSVFLGNHPVPAVFEVYARDAIHIWNRAKAAEYSNSIFMPKGSGKSPSYDLEVVQRCKERDQNHCVISGLDGIETCCFNPLGVLGQKDTTRIRNFWDIPEYFWPKEKVDMWRDQSFHKDGRRKWSKKLKNMVTLTATLNRFHFENAFTLRPVRISEDKKQLELKFHWLAREQRGPSEKVDLMQPPISSRHRTEARPGQSFVRFYDPAIRMLSNIPVSGTKIMMTTDDPVERPLPDTDLLEMRWFFQRLLAMSGAADWEEDDLIYGDL